MVKIQRWDKKLFYVLVDPIENVVNERFVESKLVFYDQRMDTQDLVVADLTLKMGICCCQIWDYVRSFSFTVRKGKISINFCSRMK